MNRNRHELYSAMENLFSVMNRELDRKETVLTARDFGRIHSVGSGIATVSGLDGVRSEEVLVFEGGRYGMAFDLREDRIGVVMLDESEGLRAGGEVNRTRQVVSVPVGEDVIGRVLDPRGEPMDGGPGVRRAQRRPVERRAPEIMERSPVTVPLQTGIKVIDTLIPVGRGQRELILGDRQTGKTAIALDTIVNQKDQGVVCVYCGIGKRASALAKAVAELEEHGAMEYTCVMVSTEEDPPGLQFIAPYAATSVGEYFMEQGRDVLIVYDDLTRHARAYRQLSLLLRRPPGREAFPGDIFYIHSRLLERSTHLAQRLGGGSLTALPIIETEAQNLSAYIPTNLISITDGQLYLSPDLFRRGVLPAVDVGKSVSRVGGKAQLPAYRIVAGDLRLTYSQFEELESFARFGARLDEETERKLARGRRVREVLKQYRYSPLSAAEQVAVLVALNNGVLDNVSLSDIPQAQEKILEQAKIRNQAALEAIASGERPGEDTIQSLVETAADAVKTLSEKPSDAIPGEPQA